MDDFDIFVCYDEATGGDFASALKANLVSRRGYRVFVAHIDRYKMKGKFRENNIDPIIDKCKIFILINTIDALDRSEVQREIQRGVWCMSVCVWCAQCVWGMWCVCVCVCIVCAV